MVFLVKAMVFAVVMCECESWSIKKAEHWKIDAFELCCQRRLLRVPWTARRSNQSILKEISPEYHWKDWCWSWTSNTLATWWLSGHLWLTHGKRPCCWKSLKTGSEGIDRGWDSWMASLTQWTWVWVSSRSWGWIENSGVLQSMGSQRVRHDWVIELNWLALRCIFSAAFVKVNEAKVPQSCLTLCNPVDYRVPEILQARILEWVALPFLGDLPNPGIKPRFPSLLADSLPAEPPGKPCFFKIIMSIKSALNINMSTHTHTHKHVWKFYK